MKLAPYGFGPIALLLASELGLGAILLISPDWVKILFAMLMAIVGYALVLMIIGECPPRDDEKGEWDD